MSKAFLGRRPGWGCRVTILACGTATRRSCCVTACQFTSFSKRLGHKDAAVTLNVYADVIPDDDSSAVDTVIKAVWGRVSSKSLAVRARGRSATMCKVRR